GRRDRDIAIPGALPGLCPEREARAWWPRPLPRLPQRAVLDRLMRGEDSHEHRWLAKALGRSPPDGIDRTPRRHAVRGCTTAGAWDLRLPGVRARARIAAGLWHLRHLGESDRGRGDAARTRHDRHRRRPAIPLALAARPEPLRRLLVHSRRNDGLGGRARDL